MDVWVSGGITVACPPGVPYSIALDAGQHFDGSYRNVSNGDDRVWYTIHHSLMEWGDANHDNTYPYGTSRPGTGNGYDQFHDFSAGLHPTTTTGSDGVYTDVVGVTVHY
jgi:spore coat protein U-like protein